jgi:hypothetical protein
MGILIALPTRVRKNRVSIYCGLMPILLKARVRAPIWTKNKRTKNITRKRKKMSAVKGLKNMAHSWRARMFNELLSRDHEDARATGKPQGVVPRRT